MALGEIQRSIPPQAREPRLLPRIAGPLVIPFLIAACSTAQAGQSPTAPEATATAFSEQVSNPSTVNIPGIGKAEVSPSPVSGTPDTVSGSGVPKPKVELPANAPQEVKDIFNGLESAKLTTPDAAKKYQEALRDAATYTNPNLPASFVENDRAGKYADLFGQLVGQWNATQDQIILEIAKQLREFVKIKYPVKYASVEKAGGWDIRE